MAHFLDIIIPEYNCKEEHIIRLLNSILQQLNVDFNEIGIILVNDDSPKKISESLLKSVTKVDIEYYFKEKNEGQGLTRQFGFEKSSAEYVTFVDQDDMLFGPTSLSETINVLKNEKPELLYTNYIDYTPESGKKKIVTYKELTCLHGVFLSRKAIIDNDIRFSDKFRMYEDTYYMIVASRLLRSKHLNIPTYIWIFNSESQIHSFKKERMIVSKINDYIDSNVEAVKFLASKNFYEERLSKEILYCIFFIIESEMFFNKDIKQLEKITYDFYKYLKNIYKFENEKDYISNSKDFIYKRYGAKETRKSFEAFLEEYE